MLDYLLRRLLLIIPTLIGITVVSYFVMRLAPGDPAALRVSDVMDPGTSAKMYMQIRERFGLDKPILVGYWTWMTKLVTGNLGLSIASEEPVVDLIARRFWPTVKVNMTALFLAFLISLPIGIYSAAKRGRLFDRVSGLVLYMLYSIPSYVGAIVLLLYFAVKWDILPLGGMASDDYADLTTFGKFVDIVAHMTLYVLCTLYGSLAYYSRFVRQNLLEVIQQDYIRTARAKGLPEHVVVLKHGFRNTLIPFLTLLGLIVPSLLGGSVILEVIFNWPGLGQLFVESIFERDYPVVMALTTATAVLVLIATLSVDLLYGFVDPRVQHR